MAASWKPEDVAAEIVMAYRFAEFDAPITDSHEDAVRHGLAAVIPLIREQVAREIEAAERALSETDPATAESSNRITAWCGGLLEGARIARGGE
jgi:hypothetical protein